MNEPTFTTLSENPLDQLGLALKNEYEEWKSLRRDIEEGWVDDVRQYLGFYDTSKVKIKPNASKAFIRITRTKVRAMDARMGELTEPSSRAIWGISPTPEPNLAPERQDMLLALLVAKGLPPEEVRPKDIRRLERLMAEAASRKMQILMEDQLVETKFAEMARAVRHNGHLFGLGILKGPMVENRLRKRWIRGGDGQHVVTEVAELRPFYESVRPFDFYFDPSAPSLERSDSYYQRHSMTRSQLRRLLRRPDFKKAAINAHISSHRDGDSEWESYETLLLGVGRFDPTTIQARPHKRYEVVEFWGSVDGRELAQHGIKIRDDALDQEFQANLWFFATTGLVIKAVLNPTDKDTRPYSFYVPEPEEGRVGGLSVPFILRDTQALTNAAVRMLVDNAAKAVEPQWEVDGSRLVFMRDVTEFTPGKVWITKSPTGVAVPAIRATNVPLHTGTFISMFQVFKSLGDEASAIPSFQHGERSPGVGRTVGGLSMLMSAANVMLKEPLKSWDSTMKTAMERLYDWNMQFSERSDIKGDFEVKVEGSYSVMSRELRADKLLGFMSATANPIDAPIIHRREGWLHYVEAMDLPAELIKNDDEIAREMEAQAAQLAAQPQPEGGAGGQQLTGGNGSAGAAPGGADFPPDAAAGEVPPAEAGASQGGAPGVGLADGGVVESAW